MSDTQSTTQFNLTATSGSERIDSIDVLRGVAVLGILTINIWLFGYPFEVGGNPTLSGEYFGADVVAWFTGWIAFEGSQRAIFTMLFGASVILFTSRLERDERRGRLTKIYYRRTLLLLLFGLADGYLLLWYGDILFFYGFVGLVLFWVRNWNPRGLFTFAGSLLLLLALFNLGTSWVSSYFGPIAEMAENEGSPSGVEITAEEQMAIEIMADIPLGEPTQEELQSEIEARQGGYLSAFPSNAANTTEAYIVFGWFSLYWEVFAFMMIGMALYKLNIFDASRSLRTYVMMLIFGWSIGILVNTWEMIDSVANDYRMTFTYWTYDIGRIAIAIGDIGLVMLICKLGKLTWLRNKLAAIGRMALSNYVAQTLICNVIFIGFSLYGELRFHQLYYVVGAIWIAQLVWSSWWLERYRYGPLEWLWRRGTYPGALGMRKSA